LYFTTAAGMKRKNTFFGWPEIKKEMKKVIALVLGVILFGSGYLMVEDAAAGKSIQVKGSDTMVHLATQWAESYMNINKNAVIAVTGGGSGTGIVALLNGTADIANASRKIRSKELKAAQNKGLEIKEHVVAWDGIAVIVNPGNPVSDITLAQLKAIYIGKIKNWQQVGGPKKKIVLVGRNTASGTYVFFNKRVCEKEDYSAKMMNLASNSAIVQTVAQDKWAIGYVGMGYLLKNTDKIKGLKVNGVLPSLETVQKNTYVISRPLQMYTVGELQGRIKDFIDFVLSETGQKIVGEAGFVPVRNHGASSN